MSGILRGLRMGAIAQYPIARLGRATGRYYYLDFALPKLRVAIECDGAAYHSTRRQRLADRRRQREIEALGWTFVRFTGSAIISDRAGCEQILRELTGRSVGKS